MDPKRWIISVQVAPHNNHNNNKTKFEASNVNIVGGLLQLKLVQTINSDGSINSSGGEVSTIAKFGYGTYEFAMKASSSEENPNGSNGKPVSGSITGAFLFANGSETEIDIEYEGAPNQAYFTKMSTWIDDKEPQQTKVISNVYGPHQRFLKYKIIWIPGKVTFYRDDKLISTHTKIVPTKPASFLFNHWGTNSLNWGGLATPNKIRYMYVKTFSFVPFENNSK